MKQQFEGRRVEVKSVNPRTGSDVGTGIVETSDSESDLAMAKAFGAAPRLAAAGREVRAAILEEMANSLDKSREPLVESAGDETGFGTPRLTGELDRAIFQFRFFANVLREGSYLEAMIDHSSETTFGPAPDLRRMLVPVGPVAVFGSSNFPFAFSVAGGDTASALAAGCPVILKAHPSHPLTSIRSFDALRSGLEKFDFPEGIVGLVFGQTAGIRLVSDPLTKAVSFTGSLEGAQALQEIINSRPEPIPFYGELSSLNPLVITELAASERGLQIAQELFNSFTATGGQLCTKPGIAFVPEGKNGDRIVREMCALISRADGQVLLNRRIFDSFGKAVERMTADEAISVAGEAVISDTSSGFLAAPTLLAIAASELNAELTKECFGPLMIVARYVGIEDLKSALLQLPNSLTAAIHAEDNEVELLLSLTEIFSVISGRIIYNGYPTGVRVSWAQHHGGPWPATNSLHSSVGATAIRRFLRPIVWQNAPQAVLPEELRDGKTGIPRRVDGVLTLPGL